MLTLVAIVAKRGVSVTMQPQSAIEAVGTVGRVPSPLPLQSAWERGGELRVSVCK